MSVMQFKIRENSQGMGTPLLADDRVSRDAPAAPQALSFLCAIKIKGRCNGQSRMRGQAAAQQPHPLTFPQVLLSCEMGYDGIGR